MIWIYQATTPLRSASHSASRKKLMSDDQEDDTQPEPITPRYGRNQLVIGQWGYGNQINRYSEDRRVHADLPSHRLPYHRWSIIFEVTVSFLFQTPSKSARKSVKAGQSPSREQRYGRRESTVSYRLNFQRSHDYVNLTSSSTRWWWRREEEYGQITRQERKTTQGGW